MRKKRFTVFPGIVLFASLFLPPFARNLPAQATSSPQAQTVQPAQPTQNATGDPASVTLSNGLELVTLVQPLAKDVVVSLSFKGGADVQIPQNAGLFNLLESVIFNGTATSPGEPEPAGALEGLGAQSLEGGGTTTDRVEFRCEIASDRIVQALDTIAYLFSDLRLDSALADPGALTTAKNLSLARISDEISTPDSIYEAALAKKLFIKAPWRLDPLGADYVVTNALPEALRTLDETWFVPNNAVLVICGNIDPAALALEAEKAFASSKKGSDPLKTALPVFPKPGVTSPTFMVYPDPSVPKGEATIEMRYRGPDSTSLPYFATAIVWAELVGAPKGRLEQAITRNMPKWSAPSGLNVEFNQSQSSSWISVSSHITVGSRTNIAEAAYSFKEIVRSNEFYAMKVNPGYFTPTEYDVAKKAILDRINTALSNPNDAAALLTKDWILGGSQFYSRLRTEFDRVTNRYLMNFADEYFMKNLEVTAIRINPDDYAANRKGFSYYGFEEVVPQKAFWWK
jgi:zinc protease